MDIDINSKSENAMLGRTDVLGEMSYSGPTPSRSEVSKKLSVDLGKDQELIIVKDIDNSFGKQKAKVSASIYKNKKSLESFESKVYTTRMLSKEEREKLKQKGSAEKPAEAKEAPKEEKKEAKAEEKPAEKPKEEAKEEKPAKE